MRESQFIKQSEKKWKNFEEDLALQRKNPDRTSKLFVQITDDLSYARTFYPNRMVRKYLDGVSQILLGRIYKNQRTPFSAFLDFWKTKLPLEVYRARRAFTVSIVVFVAAFSIGVISSIYNPDFAQVILGDSYVDMTLENIEKGDPMAVYKEFNATEGFTAITLNNISVAFRTFVFGLLAAIGSVFILIYNGIMVGAFQYFFIERDLFWESFLTIWQHGTIEISAIVIAGAAGITLGKGLILTGNHTRLQAFKISGQRGLTVFLGTVPLFIIAGFIEGFLTRDTEAHPALRLSVIIASALFIVYYFWWYPRKVGKALAHKLDENIPDLQSDLEDFTEKSIYSISELMSLAYRKVFKHPYLVFIGFSAAALSAYYFSTETLIYEDRFGDFETIFGNLMTWMDFKLTPIPPIILAVSALILSVFAHKHLNGKSIWKNFSWQKLLLAAMILLPLVHGAFWLLVLLAYPVVGLMAATSTLSESKNVTGLLQKSYGKAMGLFALVVGMSMILYIFLSLFNLYVIDGFLLFLTDDADTIALASDVVYNLGCYSIFTLSHLFCAVGFYYLYYSLEETNTAKHLTEKINLFREKYNIAPPE